MSKLDENLVVMLMERMRPEMEAKLAEAEKVARERLLLEYAARAGALAATQAPSITPSPLERRHYRTAKIRAAEGPIDWTKEIRTCAKCNHRGPVDPDFGVTKNTNGTPRAQGWCRNCRSTTDYHKRLRTKKR